PEGKQLLARRCVPHPGRGPGGCSQLPPVRTESHPGAPSPFPRRPHFFKPPPTDFPPRRGIPESYLAQDVTRSDPCPVRALRDVRHGLVVAAQGEQLGVAEPLEVAPRPAAQLRRLAGVEQL